MMKLQKFSSTALALAVSLGCVSGAAQAGVIDQYLQNGQNVLEDDSNEYLFRAAASGTGYDIITSGDVQNGDLLVQILDFSIVNGTNIDSDGNEVTGVAVNKVANIRNEEVYDPPGPRTPFTRIDFDQVAASGAEWAALTGIDTGATGYGALFDTTGLMALMFDDNKNDLDVFTQGLATALPNVLNGNLIFGLGLDAANGKDYVTVEDVPKDVGVFAPSAGETPGVTTIGGFSYGLSFLYEGINGIVLPNPDVLVSDFPGSGTNLVTDRLSIAAIIDDTQASFYAEVPEPATLAMLGAGLLGLGFGRRRKGSAKV